MEQKKKTMLMEARAYLSPLGHHRIHGEGSYAGSETDAGLAADPPSTAVHSAAALWWQGEAGSDH